MQNKKQGFTIIELVIVIAVIAILAGVLIPTFSSVLNKSRRSADISSVRDMNKQLFIEDVVNSEQFDYSDAVEVMTKGGFKIPCSPQSNGYSFYWLPENNRVVLYNEKENTVFFPDDFKGSEKTDEWINLSGNAESEEPEDDKDDAGESEQPEDHNYTYIIIEGNTFNSMIKELCAKPTKIVFGNISDHQDKIGGTSVSVSTEGEIKAYASGTEIYVLSDSDIKTPADTSGMFEGMTELVSVEFENIDTSAATVMSKLFNGCKKLKCLDLSAFNTKNVKNMESMFEGCSNINNITVKTGENAWNTDNVKSSNYMFAGCEKLRNYSTDFISDIIAFLTTRNKLYANTGTGGYLTEK